MKGVTSALAALALCFAPAAAIAQTSPSPSPSPSVPQLFTPPAGWEFHEAPLSFSTAHMLGVWMSPTIKTTASSINLAMQPLSAKDEADFAATNKSVLEKILGAQNVLAYQSAKLCNGTADGWYIESKLVFGANTMRDEQTVLVGPKHDAYVLTYARLEGVPEDSAAHASLLTLCPPSNSTNAIPVSTP